MDFSADEKNIILLGSLLLATGKKLIYVGGKANNESQWAASGIKWLGCIEIFIKSC